VPSPRSQEWAAAAAKHRSRNPEEVGDTMADPVSELTALAAGFSGTIGVWARSLDTGEVIRA